MTDVVQAPVAPVLLATIVLVVVVLPSSPN